MKPSFFFTRAYTCVQASTREGSSTAFGRRCLAWRIIAALGFVVAMSGLFAPSGTAAEPGTLIVSNPRATYLVGETSYMSVVNTPMILETVTIPTDAELSLLRYGPNFESAEMFKITEPTLVGGAAMATDGPALDRIDFDSLVPLVPAGAMRRGDVVFVKIYDLDQNLSALELDTVEIVMLSSESSDSEAIVISEVSPNSGVFVGYIQTTIEETGGNSGVLSIADRGSIRIIYDDGVELVSIVQFIPDTIAEGRVFDATTGDPVDGARLTIVDAENGMPVKVFGDDRISPFPATIESGGNYVDSGGELYDFGSGGYRFPFLPEGNYRIQIESPPGYRSPSVATPELLAQLPGGPYLIDDAGSRGESFVVSGGDDGLFDIPLDPINTALFLSITADTQTASEGDFVEYVVDVRNESEDDSSVNRVVIVDRLPVGVEYQPGSMTVDGESVPDPELRGDGRFLEIFLGTLEGGGSSSIRYVGGVTAGTPVGDAVNVAHARSLDTIISNYAEASVRIESAFLNAKTYVAGRVTNVDQTYPDNGLEGVRVYLEDGSFAMTDEKGRYHFEGLMPGTHVIQVDTSSLAEDVEMHLLADNTRFAGSAHSQFVDLQGGSFWRANFHVRNKAKPVPESKVTFVANPDGPGVRYEAVLENAGPTLKNRKAMFLLPDSQAFASESFTVDGKPFAGVELVGNIATLRLGEGETNSQSRIEFNSYSISGDNTGEAKAVLLFDAPEGKNQRNDPAIVQLDGVGSGVEAVVSKRVDGEWSDTSDSGDVVDENSSDRFLEVEWVESALVGNEVLFPGVGYRPSIPSVKVCVKHTPKMKVELLVNGTAVSSRNFDNQTVNRVKTVAVSRWAGVDIEEGMNEIVVKISDRSGNLLDTLSSEVYLSSSPVSAELIPEKSFLVANGSDSPVIAVQFRDKTGAPVRQGVVGEYFIEEPFEAKKDERRQQSASRITKVGNQRPRYQVGDNGIALIELEPTQRTGEALLRFPLEQGEREVEAWINAELRDWILVGLVEGTATHDTVSGNMETFVDATKAADSYQKDGRIAFYAKGQVKGEWLLTAAYDSAKDTKVDDLEIRGGIDPEAYYTLYADSTERIYDAVSDSKLYLKIERSSYYAVYGYNSTGLSVTELSAYNRHLNGFRSEYRDERFSLNVFAAENDQKFVKDEIRGDGTSGLYRLTTKGILFNSEVVKIQIRDRFRSNIIIEERPLSRHTDYNIDYLDGTLFFRQPVLSHDVDLNEVYIVVDYETSGQEEEDHVFGGRGSVSFFDKALEVGASYVHEGAGLLDSKLKGLDATLKLGERLRAKAEVAHSESMTEEGSRDGDATLFEVDYSSEMHRARLYFQELDKGFGLGHQNQNETGTRKMGLDGESQITENLKTSYSVYQEEDTDEGSDRQQFELGLIREFDQSRVGLGYRFAEDTDANGNSLESQLGALEGQVSLLNGKLLLRGTHEQAFSSGNNENPAYPTRSVLGAEYRLSETTIFELTQEFSSAPNGGGDITRLGVKRAPWKGAEWISALESQEVEGENNLLSTSGLTQELNFGDKWKIEGSIDRSSPISGSSKAEDFTALSVGSEYRDEAFEWNARAEWRTSDSGDRWGLASGALMETEDGRAFSLVGTYFESNGAEGAGSKDLEFRFGAAFRPDESRWMFLNRLDLNWEQSDSLDSIGRDEWKLVENFTSYFELSAKTELSVHAGAKYVKATLGEDRFDSYTTMLGVQATHDISEKYDVTLKASSTQTWDTGQNKYSMGVALGRSLSRNVRLSVGYNLEGYDDEDFAGSGYTKDGAYIKLQMKFDQDTIRERLKIFSKEK